MIRARRRLLQAGLALPAALCAPRWGAGATPTPACGDDARTPSQTSGPFYTPRTPEKRDFRKDDPAGEPLELQATVVDTQCRPLAGVIVDLWHADSAGRYDNDGFRLRGHQRADAAGVVRFDAVKPGHYYGRTRHFHVRLFAADGARLLTTQLYFPGEPANGDDGLFDPRLLLELAGGAARFRFVVAAQELGAGRRA